MSNKEFDNIKPKPPEMQPSPVEIPTELETVEAKQSPKVKFSFGNYMRFVYLYLLGELEDLLPEQVEAAQKVISWGTVASVFAVILIVALVTWVF